MSCFKSGKEMTTLILVVLQVFSLAPPFAPCAPKGAKKKDPPAKTDEPFFMLRGSAPLVVLML